MCGILFSWDNKNTIQRKTFDIGLTSLDHRGPDERSVWISDCEHIALGHTRLSINDITGGSQPLLSDDGLIIVVVNGEFYDHRNIRRKLAEEGYQFRTQSDSEILIALYKKFGFRCLDHLNGEFSFILSDLLEKRIFAARDRFGVKPLYYFHIDGKLVMASECKALFKTGVKPAWDQRTAIKNDHLFMISQSDTLFDRIFQIKPGCYITYDGKSFEEVSYWDLKFPKENQLSAVLPEEEKQISIYRNKLIAAVQRRLDSDVPVAVYLSGGLDSSAILGIASSLSSTAMDAYSIGFNDDTYDETEASIEMAKHCGANHHLIVVNDQLLADNFEKTVWHCEAPMFNLHSVAKFILSKMVKQDGYKAVLTGEGSDDILGGYAFLRKDIIQSSLKLNEREKRECLDSLERNNKIYGSLFSSVTASGMESVQSRLGYLPSYMETGKNYYLSISELYSDESRDFANRLDVFGEFLEGIRYREVLMGMNRLDQTLYMWCKSHFPTYILSLVGDRVEMGNSIEGRLPFLDLELVEFSVGISTDLKMKDNKEKYILREAAKEFITETVYFRQKQPFLAPPINLDSNSPIGQLVHDTFNGSQLDKIPIFSRKKVLKMLDRAMGSSIEERKHYDKMILQILSMCFLQDKFNPTHNISSVEEMSYVVGA